MFLLFYFDSISTCTLSTDAISLVAIDIRGFDIQQWAENLFL